MERENDKVLFGVMTIIFNSIGVPFFMRGFKSNGIKRIVLSIVTCGVMGVVFEIKGIIGGIKILQMPDEDYMNAKYDAEGNKQLPTT